MYYINILILSILENVKWLFIKRNVQYVNKTFEPWWLDDEQLNMLDQRIVYLILVYLNDGDAINQPDIKDGTIKKGVWKCLFNKL